MEFHLAHETVPKPHTETSFAEQAKLEMAKASIEALRMCMEVYSGKPNVRANRHFAAGRVWAKLLKPKLGPPQSVRLSEVLAITASGSEPLDWGQ